MLVQEKPNNLVLIHGWSFNSEVWQFNLEYLSGIYNIITIDLNGHGATKYNYIYEDIDLYLQELINLIPDNSDILGWSLGGSIGLQLKYKYPKKIKKIILCCSSPCFINNENWVYGVDEEIWHNFNNQLINDYEATIKNFLLMQILSQPNAKNLYKKLINTCYKSVKPDPMGLSWGLTILKNDYRHLLKQIDNNNIKFIFGANDLLINKKIITWLLENHPKIKTCVLNSSGHLPFITQPEEFYRELIA